jgi:hypothetical protein
LVNLCLCQYCTPRKIMCKIIAQCSEMYTFWNITSVSRMYSPCNCIMNNFCLLMLLTDITEPEY